MRGVARIVDPLLGVVDARFHAIGVPDLAAPMAAGNELHAATAHRSIGKREPGSHVLIIRLQAEVGRVLVPAGDVRRSRLLDEPGAREYQDIGTDHVLDRIEDRRMTGELVRPATQEIGARAVLALLWRERAAERRAD